MHDETAVQKAVAMGVFERVELCTAEGAHVQTVVIPNDEPVFLLRGQDKYAAEVVLLYAQNILADELAPLEARAVAQRCWDWAIEMREWGERNRVKFPDMPSDA